MRLADWPTSGVPVPSLLPLKIENQSIKPKFLIDQLLNLLNDTYENCKTPVVGVFDVKFRLGTKLNVDAGVGVSVAEN